MMSSFRSAGSGPMSLSPSRRAARCTVEAMEVRTLLSAVLVKDINPGPSSSVPQHGVDVNGELYFSADDGTHGFEVWKSDGTGGGTSLLKDINLTPNAAGEPFDLTNVNGTLYFVEDLAQLGLGHDFKLFRSNGTAAGTAAIADLQLQPQGNLAFYDPQLTTAGGALYFYDGDTVYKTDPSTTAIAPASNASAGVPRTLLTFGAKALLDSPAGPFSQGEMEVLNGGGFIIPGAVTTPVDTAVGVGAAPAADVLNGLLYYLSAVPASGAPNGSMQPALYRTDGTQAGTALVRSFSGDHFSESPTSSIPMDNSRLYVAGGKLLFNLRSGLWVSDGTGSQSTLLSSKLQLDVRPVELNGAIYFIAHDRTNNYVKQLWKTDGTVAGTVLLMDNIADHLHDAQLTTFNGLLYFTAPNGQMLWQSDGTLPGTQPVPGVSYETNSNANESFILPQSGGKLYFSPTAPQYGLELWKIDPTVTLAPLVIHGTSHDDTITVSVASGILQVNVNGTETDYTPAQYVGGITIDTGGSDSAGDSLTILGLPAVQTTGFGEGLLKATVGSSSRGLADIAATDLKLGGSTGTVQLTVNDSSDATARHLTLGTSTDSGVTYDVLHGLTPGNIRATGSLLVVNLGNAGNTVDVTGTAPAPNPVPTFAVVNLNTGNGDDTVNVNATGTGTVLNINGQNGHDQVNLTDPAAGVQNVRGVVNVSNPLGHTTMLIDDTSDTATRSLSLDAFNAGNVRYGILQGLGPAPIDFAGANVDRVNILGPLYVANSLVVNNTPGGGRIFISGLATARVLGTAPGQPLDLIRQFLIPQLTQMTVDFSTGRIGAGAAILADAEILNVIGASPADQFNGAFTRVADGSGVGFVDDDIDQINFSNGTLTTSLLSGRPGVGFSLGPHATATFTGPDVVLGSLSIDASSSLTLSPGSAADSPDGLTVFGTLSLQGKLDLTNNNVLELPRATADQVRALVRQGLGGRSGITSSAADATHNLGYAPNANNAGFTVRLTLYGDANLDGKVDFNDLLALAQNYGRDDVFWYQGDFNYDGRVNFADALRLAQNYGKRLGWVV